MMNGWIGRPEMIQYPSGNTQSQVGLFISPFFVCLSNKIGSCAGIMEHCGMFPLDTIKVTSCQLITLDSFISK